MMAQLGRVIVADEGCRIAVVGALHMPVCESGRFGKVRPLCSSGEFCKQN